MNSVSTLDQPDLIREISEHALLEAAGLIRLVTGREITIAPVSCGLVTIDGVHRSLSDASSQQLLIRQALSGSVNGYASLLVAKSCAQDLVRDLLLERPRLIEMTELEEEAVSEIANILINCCLENVIELKKQRCGSAVPEVLFGRFPELLDELTMDSADEMVFHLQAEVSGISKSCPVVLLFAAGLFV